MSDRRARGRQAEDRAAAFLIARGYELVERNFTSRYGEIDLICRDGDTLVFVEVKMRRPKQRRLISAAEDYLQKQGDANLAASFDVVAITEPADDDRPIRLIKNAIEHRSVPG